MAVQRRQHRRVSLGYPAYMMSVDHVLVTKCRVEDVSKSGMKITLEYPEDAPAEFILLLTGPRGGVTRLCKVVRRDETSVGVVYDHTVVPEVVQKTSRTSCADRRFANGGLLEEPLVVSTTDSSEGAPPVGSQPSSVSLSLADVRLLRRIAHFGGILASCRSSINMSQKPW